MIPVVIDLSAISEEFNLPKDEFNSFANFVLEEVAASFAKEWEEEAKQSLHQSKNEYIRGIYVKNINNTTKVVGLAGWLPNAVEEGISGFDEKPGFARSAKIHFKKDGTGWYLTIPYKTATPNAIAESTIFSGKMPNEIYQVLKAKAKTGDTTGLKLGEIPKEFQIPKTRPEVKLESKTFEAYTHKPPIYEGIIKSPIQYHSGYTSFRRVSNLSDPNSWIHTGIEGRNLAEKALESTHVDQIVDQAIDAFLQTL